MESSLTNFARSTESARKSRTGTLAAAVGVGAIALAFASPAFARNDFANAFERELGRIVAHDVATAAHLLLPPVPVVVHETVHYRPVGPRFFPLPHHVVAHRHFSGCGHRGWHGRHDRYDRRDRYDRHDRHRHDRRHRGDDHRRGGRRGW